MNLYRLYMWQVPPINRFLSHGHPFVEALGCCENSIVPWFSMPCGSGAVGGQQCAKGRDPNVWTNRIIHELEPQPLPSHKFVYKAHGLQIHLPSYKPLFGKLVIEYRILYRCPPAIKHGVLEDGPFMGDFPLKTSFHRGFASQPCLMTRW